MLTYWNDLRRMTIYFYSSQYTTCWSGMITEAGRMTLDDQCCLVSHDTTLWHSEMVLDDGCHYLIPAHDTILDLLKGTRPLIDDHWRLLLHCFAWEHCPLHSAWSPFIFPSAGSLCGAQRNSSQILSLTDVIASWFYQILNRVPLPDICPLFC